MAYNTKQRTLIYNFIKEQKHGHVTANDIIEAMSPHGIGSATVYRYLEKLVKSGELRKFSGNENEGFCYQFAEDGKTCSNHYHFLCEYCGKCFHVECGHLDDIDDHLLNDHNFEVDLAKTVFRGACRECKINQRGGQV